MPDINADFRRLAARGTFQITPLSRPDACISLQWWPHGQHYNPFCQRGFLGRTLAEVLSRAVDSTRPSWHSLETLVNHYLYERELTRQASRNG